MYDSLFHCGFLYGFLDLAKGCVMSGGTEIGLRACDWNERHDYDKYLAVERLWDFCHTGIRRYPQHKTIGIMYFPTGAS